MLSPGTIAPDFTLFASPTQMISLHDFLGKRVILAFYPADWSPVCGDQMTLYNEMLTYFTRLNAQLLGISVDSKWSHHAFTRKRKLEFPLLSDFEPKGDVARSYGVYDSQNGEARRALVVVDEWGTIHWVHIALNGQNPGADGILRVLEEMNKGIYNKQY